VRIFERTEQLACLDALLTTSRASGCVALIGGEAGAGKSALVEAFCEQHADTTTILVGRCDDLLSPRPLGPLSDIGRSIGGRLRDSIEAGDQRAAFDAFLDVLESACSPTIVVLEDLQWADDATLDLLQLTARRLDLAQAMLIATYRDDLAPEHPLRGVLAALKGPNVRRVSLPPLSLDAVRSMTDGHAIDPVKLHQATAGNPFYVVEVLATEPWTIPSTVRDAVLARVAQLSGGGRDALAAAAILGSSASPEAIMTVAECGPHALDECIATGLLEDHGTTLTFRHDISRATVEDSLTPWRRRVLHGRALVALGLDADVVALANHAIAAGDSAAVLRWAPLAAERSQALGANRAVAALYGRAVEHATDAPEEEQIALLEAHSRACARVADHQTAFSSGERVLAYRQRLGEPHSLGEWLYWMSRISGCVAVDKTRSTAYLRESLEVLEPLGDTPELAKALVEVTCQAGIWGDVALAMDAGTRGLKLAEQFGDESLICRFLCFMGCAQISSGHPEGYEYYASALERAEASGDPLGKLRVHNNVGSVLDQEWRPIEALGHLRLALDLATAHELSISPTWVREEIAHAQLIAGRYDDALATVALILDDRDTDELTRSLATSYGGRIATRRGHQNCRDLLDEAARIVEPSPEMQQIHPVLISRAEAHWYAGDLDAAGADVAKLIPIHEGRYEPWRRGELRLWGHRIGVECPGVGDVMTAFDLHVAGRFREAAAEFEARGCPFEAADALGDSDDEHDLRRSLEILHEIGATARAAQVTKCLRSLGVRAIPRGPRASTRAHGSGLTAREAEVAGLLAQGFSNAQIADKLVLSAKTVDHHVSAVLTKLGVASRRDVGAALAS